MGDRQVHRQVPLVAWLIDEDEMNVEMDSERQWFVLVDGWSVWPRQKIFIRFGIRCWLLVHFTEFYGMGHIKTDHAFQKE
jgi:hypothetical protein